MKKIPFLVCLVIVFSLSASAQVRRISGKVIDDSTGIGLPNVSVTVSGTTKGTTTAADGVFVLTYTPDGKRRNLVISNTGYGTVSQSLGTTTDGLIIHLKKEVKTLDDVVIIGYQSVRRRDLLASVSSVTSRDLKDIPLNSAEEGLAGRLAGVQVTGSEGSPNAQVFIRVRGGGSITQSNNPLYVVDGVQVDNALSTMSLQDIESINVLKDAAATSIYGARGSNGVVIITTKGGQNTGGKTRITYTGFLGVNTLEKKLPVQSPYDFMYYQFERAQQTGDSSGIAPYGNSWDTVQKYKTVAPYDWQQKMLGRHAFSQTHNVSVTGGTEQTQYNLSVSDNTQEGVMLNSDYARKLLAFRFDHRASEKLRIGSTIRFNNTTVDGAGTSNPGSSSLNFLRQIIRYRPFLVAGQAANSFDPTYYAETNANSLNLVNPVLLNQAQYRKSYLNVLDINAYANYTFTKWLSFRSTFGYDNNNMRMDAFDDTLTTNAKNNGANMPIADITTTIKSSIDNSNVFTLTNSGMSGKFKEHNDISLILGQETYQTNEKDNYVQTNYFPVGTTASAALGNMNLGSPPNTTLAEPKPTSTIVNTSLLSFFSQVRYAYDGKYLFSASIRADGSSLFAEKNRWGYFPAASAAWRISKENFLDNVSWINDLKIRVAYGEAGNNRISPYQYVTQFNTTPQYALSNGLTTAFGPAGLANPDLKWESTLSRNLGVDASLFKDRFGFTVDVYSNTTRQLLIAVPVPTTSGYTTQIQNVGSTTNKGIEVQLYATIMQTNAFRWSATYNMSFNKNTITSLGQQQSYLANSGWAGSSNPADFIVKVGQPVGAMWGLVNDGFYKTSDFNYNTATRVYTLKPGIPSSQAVTATLPMPGGQKFKALNGDTTVTTNSRTIIGNTQPKFFGGLSQNFSYKGFDCSIFINFQYGNKVYNYNKLEFSSGYTPGASLLGIMKNRWHTVDANGNTYEGVSGTSVVGASPDSLNALNKGAKYWIPVVGSSATTFSPQSWAVEDGSFIRINNITLGYTLPLSVISHLKIARLRVYGTVNNVAVLTGYSGYDPEVNTRSSTPVTPGVDYSAYPRSRSFIAGVNVTF
ncbi:MAG TPA: SusC/RagA family TonB-linked outer membrane protein [Puia sp.]|jgi:TonB-linked SusC/RagA family outer membrane protein